MDSTMTRSSNPEPMSFDEFKAIKRQSQQRTKSKSNEPAVMSFDEFKAARRGPSQKHDRRSKSSSRRESTQSKPSVSSQSRKTSASSSRASSRNSSRGAVNSGVLKTLNKATKAVTASMATTKTANTAKVKAAVSNARSTARNTNDSRIVSTKITDNKPSPGKKYPDYMTPHDVILTPPRTPAPGPTDYLVDPNTPHCIRGAISAGLTGLSEKKPGKVGGTKRDTQNDLFLGLPEGMPNVVVWEEGWEEAAGFGPKSRNNQLANNLSEASGVSAAAAAAAAAAAETGDAGEANCERMDSDRSVIHGRSSMARTTMSSECEGVLLNADTKVQEFSIAAKQDDDFAEVANEEDQTVEQVEMYEKENEHPPEPETNEVEEEEEDPRNASMWVAAEQDDDDTIMNLGDIIVDYDEEFEDESPTSLGTVHIGDVYPFNKEDVSEKCNVIEGAVSIEAGSIEESDGRSPANKGFAEVETSPEKSERFSGHNAEDSLPFQTPFSVLKGERPLTFTEFKCMNQRVLFDPSSVAMDAESISQPHSYEEPTTSNAMSRPLGKQPAIEQHPRYSTDWLYAEDNNTSVKVESSKRQLKGRMLLIRIGKKISKVKNKGKNVLKQVFVLPTKTTKRESIDASVDNMVLSLPNTLYHAPSSPSSVSVASIASSVITGASKRVIGAIPVCYNQPPPVLGLPYGAINYTRSATDSTVGDSLPPPPEMLPRPNAEDLDDEDAVSFIAAAMMDAGEAALTEEDTASIMAIIDAEQLQDGDESVVLVTTPNEDGEGSYQVIGGFDVSTATPINVKHVTGQLNEDEESATISDLKPNNLQAIFADKNKDNTSAQIIEAGDGIVLTPTQVNHHNTSSVFRKSTEIAAKNAVPIRRSTGTPIVEPALDAATLPSLLPAGLESDDEEEDETLLYHDGCTVIKQSETFETLATTGDATASGPEPEILDILKEEQAANQVPTKTPATKSTSDADVTETPMLTPDQPTLSKQAAKNGSFLFSENNMGRAGPRIRAQERAAIKQGVAPSLTMLPPAAKSMDSQDVNAIVSRLSYSSISDANSRLSDASQIIPKSTNQKPSIAIQPSIEFKKSFDNSIKVEIQKKPIMSSMTENRQFSFKSTLEKFVPEPANRDEASAPLDESNRSKSQEFATPLVTNCTQKKKKYPTTPFPENVVTNDDVTDSPLCVEPQCANSPTGSTASKSSRKKSSPKYKNVPKSALKTRKGLVKDRISDIQQRIEGSSSSVTGVGGRLKKNHSYKLKNDRRMTGGDSVLAPRKATLQNPIFAARSVPLGISKSYSREEDEVDDDSTIKSQMTGYASKYMAANGSHNISSPCSASGSSCVSESTECDPFNTLLGKNTDTEGESSDDSPSQTGKHIFFQESKGKENTPTNGNSLPFKANALVKPTEINQHDRRVGFASSTYQSSAPLSRNPVQARSWRQLAAAAKESSSR
eukprot:scaffold6272_cov58-Cyclotella_meneghiniana.AAC.2